MPNTKSYIFVHIAKTAGSTLLSIMENVFNRDEILYLYDNDDYPQNVEGLKRMSGQEKRRYRLFTGHFPFGLHEYISQPCKYITILREPVDRVISTYNHIKNVECMSKDEDFRKRWEEARKMSLEEFVKSDILPYQSNYKVYCLADRAAEYGDCSVEDLERAKKNLREHFVIAGLTERFDETVVYIRRNLGWVVPYYAKMNVREGGLQKEDLPEGTLRLIEEKNWIAIELYKYATELFNEMIGKQGPDFQREVAELKKANSCISDLMHERDDLALHADGLARSIAEMSWIHRKQAEEFHSKYNELIRHYENSLSWRMTAPMRRSADFFHKINGPSSKGRA